MTVIKDGMIVRFMETFTRAFSSENVMEDLTPDMLFKAVESVHCTGHFDIIRLSDNTRWNGFMRSRFIPVSLENV